MPGALEVAVLQVCALLHSCDVCMAVSSHSTVLTVYDSSVCTYVFIDYMSVLLCFHSVWCEHTMYAVASCVYTYVH